MPEARHRCAAEAVRAGDVSARGLAGYRRRLEASFVLANHKKLRNAPHLVLGERTQRQYPQFICNLAEQVFTVTDPEPKKGMRRWARQERKRAGVRLRDLARDGWTGWRTFG